MDENIDPTIYFQYTPYFAGLSGESREIQLKFLEHYRRLTDDVRDLMTSEKTAEYIWSLGQSNNFSEEQTKSVAKIISKIFVGEFPREDLSQQLQQAIGCDPSYADELAQFISQDLFSSVQEMSAPEPSDVNISEKETDTSNIVDLRKLSQ